MLIRLLLRYLILVLLLLLLFSRRKFRRKKKRIHPDAVFRVGWFFVYPDRWLISSLLANGFLEKVGSRRRIRIISSGAPALAIGFWTPEEAAKVVSQMEIGEDGNLRYAKKRSGILHPLQFLGMIE